jgi:hypothetical protein
MLEEMIRSRTFRMHVFDPDSPSHYFVVEVKPVSFGDYYKSATVTFRGMIDGTSGHTPDAAEYGKIARLFNEPGSQTQIAHTLDYWAMRRNLGAEAKTIFERIVDELRELASVPLRVNSQPVIHYTVPAPQKTRRSRDLHAV